MVRQSDWSEMAQALVEYNVGAIIPARAGMQCGRHPLRNGMSGVEKGDIVGGVQIHRPIMNLVPLNSISLQVNDDVATLPLLQHVVSP